MNISIIGASGGVGREIAIQLIRDRVLESRGTLQLVNSDPHSPHPHLLHGLRADLLDAYAEIAPRLEVANDVEDVNGDIVVMTAGRTFATSPEQVAHASRDELARENKPIFERCARAVATDKRAAPPLVIVVTNPVELGVHIFAQYLPRECVIGMGAYSDSLRFRAEIAHDLDVRRQRVQGYIIDEHGAGLVPLWSSVRVSGLSAADWTAYRGRVALSAAAFPTALAAETGRLVAILRDDPHDGPLQAFEYIAGLPPELRVALKPLATHYTEAKTIVATAHATVDLVEWI
jgi:malate dehydrogenase